MKKIRVVHYGIGHDHSGQTLRCVRKYPDVFELVGVCEPNQEIFQKISGEKDYIGVNWLTEEEMFALKDIDAAIVEAYDLDLVSYAQKCADKGWHVHMDKSAGTDIEAYAKLLRTLRDKNLVFQIGYMYRYNPAVQYALQAVKDGKLGEVYNVDAIMNTRHDAEKREWMSALPGGDMLYLGCHMVDLVYMFMGVPDEMVRLTAHTKADGVDFDDNCFVAMKYPKGTSTARASAMEVNGFARRQAVICGEKGTIEICPLEPYAARECYLENHYSYGDRSSQVELPVSAGRYDEMMLDFAAFVRGEKQNPFTLEYEYQLHKLVLTACGQQIDYKKQDL